jgi:hypothetical protein
VLWPISARVVSSVLAPQQIIRPERSLDRRSAAARLPPLIMSKQPLLGLKSCTARCTDRYGALPPFTGTGAKDSLPPRTDPGAGGVAENRRCPLQRPSPQRFAKNPVVRFDYSIADADGDIAISADPGKASTPWRRWHTGDRSPPRCERRASAFTIRSAERASMGSMPATRAGCRCSCPPAHASGTIPVGASRRGCRS